MVLPGGLVAGHLAAAAVATGHQTTSSLGGWGSSLLQALLCIGLPLAGWAGLAAVRDGWRGRSAAVSPLVLIVQQVAAFVALDVVEHALAGVDPWSTARSGGFWVTVAAHALAGALAWAALRVASRVGRGLARLRRTRCVTWGSAPTERLVETVTTPVLALSSLSRRGPPVGTPALHLI